MEIKDRFTAFENVITGSILVIDNKEKRTLSIVEAEIICQDEYGEHFSAKSEFISSVIDSLIAGIKHYNTVCEKGFEITISDIVNKFKQDEKRTQRDTQ
jgi:hypothetical protein